jgi:hypothetical protein
VRKQKTGKEGHRSGTHAPIRDRHRKRGERVENRDRDHAKRQRSPETICGHDRT